MKVAIDPAIYSSEAEADVVLRDGSTATPPLRPPGRPGHDRVPVQSGGLGIATIEAAARLGVGLSSFVSVGNKADLSSNDFLQYWDELPDAASVINPIDMIATASAEDYAGTLERLADSGEFDAILDDCPTIVGFLVIFVPPLVTDARDVAEGIRRTASAHRDCAVAAVFMTAEGPPDEPSNDGLSVPGYQFPEEAARAIAHAVRYGAWRARPAGAALTADPETVAAGDTVIGGELARGAQGDRARSRAQA